MRRRHDPFVYFHSVIDNRRYCDKHVVALGSPSGEMPAAALRGETGLATDLEESLRRRRTFSFITPNLCDDGHDYPCKNQPSGASALADIDAFLETWVPKITNSPAYRKNGLIEITFDESDGPDSRTHPCCEETPGPGSPLPGHHRTRRRDGSARCCSPHSSNPAPSARSPTTTTPRSRAGSRCSGSPGWPTRQACRAASARTCSAHAADRRRRAMAPLAGVVARPWHPGRVAGRRPAPAPSSGRVSTRLGSRPMISSGSPRPCRRSRGR